MMDIEGLLLVDVHPFPTKTLWSLISYEPSLTRIQMNITYSPTSARRVLSSLLPNWPIATRGPFYTHDTARTFLFEILQVQPNGLL